MSDSDFTLNFIHSDGPLHLPRPRRVTQGTIDEHTGMPPEPELSSGKSWMFLLCREGVLKLWLLGHEIALMSGDAILLWRTNFSHRFLPNESPARFIMFEASGFDALVDEILSGAHVPFSIPPNSSVVRQLQAYHAYDDEQLKLGRSEGLRLCGSVLAAIIDSQKPRHEHSPIVDSFLRLVQKRLESRATLFDLARELNVSQEHLIRIFHREIGTTPGHLLIERRMARACELLKGSSQSITDIANRLGYDNPSSFSRAFKEITALTPREYRKSKSVALLSNQ